MPINISANENSINSLEKGMMKLTKKVDKILLDSQRARAISEKYKKIATQHLNVVVEYNKQKSDCMKLENIYKEQRIKKILDKRIIKKQDRNIVSCYKTLEALNYNFDEMSRDFIKLEKTIKTLNDMMEIDTSSLKSLNQQI